MKQLILFIISSCLALALQAQLVVQNGATLTTANGASVTLKDADLVCDGSISQAIGTDRFVFNGSTASTISGSGAIGITIFEIAKTGSNSVKLLQDVQVSKSVLFTSGIIDMADKNIQLATDAALQNETEASHITGNLGRAYIENINAPASAAGYNAATLGAFITSSQNMGTLSISRNHKPIANLGASSLTSIQRNFTITPTTNANLAATLRFYYLDAELNGKEESSLALWRSEDGVTWALQDIDTRNTTDNYVEKTGIASFSVWTLAGPGAALPVKLVSFSATCQQSYVLLKWQTATEQNAAYFLLEKSNDGVNWAGTATVPAQNKPDGAAYSVKDVFAAGNTFYRIKTVDMDGSFSVSPVFSGGCNDIALPLAVFPNPVESIVNFKISSRQTTKAVLTLYNTDGQLLLSRNWPLQPGLNSLAVDVSRYAAATYFVKVEINGAVQRVTLVKQ